MKLDGEVLAQYSTFVETEGEPTWASVPMTPAQARSLGVDREWVPHLTANVAPGRCVSGLWEPVAAVLPRTAKGLAQNSAALAVLKTPARGLSLVYFLGDSPDFVVRRGYAPARTLPAMAKQFPIDLHPFYGLHNGFVSLITDEQGPLPTQNWLTFPHPKTASASFIGVVQDGSKVFGFDISDPRCEAYLLQPDIGEVEIVRDQWAYLDRRMAQILEAL